MKKKDNVYAYLYGGNIYVNLTNRCCNNCTFCLRNTGDGVSGSVLWLEKEPTAAEAETAVKKQSIKFVQIPSLDDMGSQSKTVPAAITAKRLKVSVLAGLGCLTFFLIIGILRFFNLSD